MSFIHYDYRARKRAARAAYLNWKFIAFVLATVVFDAWFVLYVLAPMLDRIADWFVRRMP